ncbi:IS66 family transposase [Candidatus Woesearchaeota archaeon]|nr:IS66 family transposase [Candidatus Woesearchaeota archaeon]
MQRHRRGAPKGHPGTTKPRLQSHEKLHIPGGICPNCLSKDIEIIGQRRQQQEEMPPDIRPQTVDVVRDVCRCNKCKLKFLARDGVTPVQGRFGINLMVLVLFLKFIVRGVLRKTSSFLNASFALKIAPASVQAIIERAANAGEAEYAALKSRIKAAKLLYIDETSFRVLGRNWWVWVFRSDTDLLLAIRNSRGNNVLEEILGKDYAGIVVCDCWRAYDFLTCAILQRCWAHLLRKSAELKSVSGIHFHKKLYALFEQMLKFNSKERTDNKRRQKYAQMACKMQKLITYYSRYEECLAVTKYINFHIENWFTCIKIAGVKPTNNYAEQAIRETVLVRKIIGAFRSEKGTKTYETLASLIATWQYQKLDIKKELHRMLSANLC